MARAAACFNTNSDVESSIEDCDQPSVRLQNVVANKKDEPLNDNKNNPCYVLVENEVIQNTTSLESWQEITDSGNYGLEYTVTHNTPDLHQSKDQVLTDNVTQSVPIASQYVNQKQFAEHVLKEGTNTFTDFGFDESMSEPPTPLPTRRPRFDSELSCSVSTMSEISTSSSQLQTQNRPGSHVRIYNMHIANADLRTVHTEKAEITNVNIDKAENVNSSNDSNKTNSRNTDAGLKIIG
ncbi:Hypothetical predicted protein [Mytilus galloprovincialis]|uniref:Uncharacterized protein n=1 Tax=Mytilus galloprovincialis TaxID=29158 RepID=A0A8B6FHA8_MYTGA|nr:Hypothetical predicted protein [Mytilus galloprovincialis]